MSNIWLDPIAKFDGRCVMDRIADRFILMYGRRFLDVVDQAGGLDVWKAFWAAAFVSERLTYNDVKRAMSGLVRAGGDPPTLPEFIDCASPIPSAQDSFAEAQRNVSFMTFGDAGAVSWSHPAVYWAAYDFGFFDLRQSTFATGGRRWRSLLRSRLRSNYLPPIPNVETKRPWAERVNREVGRSAMVHVKELLAGIQK